MTNSSKLSLTFSSSLADVSLNIMPCSSANFLASSYDTYLSDDLFPFTKSTLLPANKILTLSPP